MKALVTGADGLMGRYLLTAGRRAGHEVVPLSHAALDLTDGAAVARSLDEVAPDVVINAAALCHFDRCEENPDQSEAINLRAPVRLAEEAAARGIRVVLFSSDYVFDGAKRSPYREEDAPHPQSVYARHKAAMEDAVAEMEHVFIARCAWIFGRGGATFMSRMPGLMMTQEEVTVAAGKRGSCLFAGYGAEVIFELLARRASGLVNVVHAGETAWEIFAQRCLEEMRQLGWGPRCVAIRPVSFHDLPALRPGRPEYSVLATDRLRELLGREPMDWGEGLRRFLGETALESRLSSSSRPRIAS